MMQRGANGFGPPLRPVPTPAFASVGAKLLGIDVPQATRASQMDHVPQNTGLPQHTGFLLHRRLPVFRRPDGGMESAKPRVQGSSALPLDAELDPTAPLRRLNDEKRSNPPIQAYSRFGELAVRTKPTGPWSMHGVCSSSSQFSRPPMTISPDAYQWP